MVQREELKRAGGRLKANTAPGIDGVPNEILKKVIGAYAEILLEAFNSCLRDGRFFIDRKKQRLVLLRKGNKPLEDASSYRSICLLDTMGKLLEEMILQRRERPLRKPVRLSERFEAMMRKKVPDYRLRMIDNYLSDRWVIYEGDKWSLKEEMTCGAPQGSRVGPHVWNVMYDDFLRMDLPAGTSIVGFADDKLVVCAADDVRILELRINESL